MTEFLIAGRGAGKTHEAIRWVRGAGNRYLVVGTGQEAAGIRATDKSTTQGSALHPEKVRVYGNHRYNLSQTCELGVDNLDLLLRTVFGLPVGFVTATGTLRAEPHLAVNQILIGGTA